MENISSVHPANYTHSSLASIIEQYIRKAEKQKLHRNRFWIRLLHYRKKWTGYVSEADSPEFFLSQNGKTDPAAELRANIIGLFSPLPSDDNKKMRCQFPLRARFLMDKLKIAPELLPSIQCYDFNSWYGHISPKSISIIFSSYYMGNPASLFGHTFVKLSKDKGTPLLDYAFNFAAEPFSNNPIVYTIGGLSGWFAGYFRMALYFHKVQEYNDREKRDLWEYKLRLSENQKERMILHLWELGQIRFDYFYFDENCSYQVLPLMEVVNPDWLLSDALFIVQPADTLRLLRRQTGLIEKIHYRPSHYSIQKLQIAELTTIERKAFDDLMAGKVFSTKNFQKSAIRKIYDTALNTLQIKIIAGEKLSTQKQKIYQDILTKRAALGNSSDSENFSPRGFVTDPSLGHPASRVQLSYLVNNHSSLLMARFAPSLHELTDSTTGYNVYSQFLLGDIRLGFDIANSFIQWPEKKAVDYENNQKAYPWTALDLLNIISLSPLNTYHKALSWKLNVGFSHALLAQNFKYLDIGQQAVISYLNFGIGTSWEILSQYRRNFLLFYGFISGEIFAHESLSHKTGGDLFFQSGLLWHAAEHFSLLAQYQIGHRWLSQENQRVLSISSLTMAWHIGSQISISLSGSMEIKSKELFSTLSIRYYFFL